MAVTLATIANNAGIKLGGFGDQIGASGQVTDAQLTANADPISQAINQKYPVIRAEIYSDFASMQSPFMESFKFARLDGELTQNDKDITTIVVVAGVVTVTTDEAHGYTTGDTRFIKNVQGTGGIVSINGINHTLTVVDTTSFTLDGITGTDSWDHTENTGVSSEAPEIGRWLYAFDLPTDYLAMVKHTTVAARFDNSPYTSKGSIRPRYRYRTLINRLSDGLLMLTDNIFSPIPNNITGTNATAYIEYVIDQTDFDLFSSALTECLAMKLASELSPMVGRNTEFRQALLAEYVNKTIPEAKKWNQSQFDITARAVPDYKGGRSGSLTRRTGHNDLGYTAI